MPRYLGLELTDDIPLCLPLMREVAWPRHDGGRENDKERLDNLFPPLSYNQNKKELTPHMSMYSPNFTFTRLVAHTLPVSDAPRPLASEAVLDGHARGRCAVEIVNTSSAPVYVGDDAVSKTNGLPINAGEKRFFPVTLGSVRALYIAAESDASVTIAEYFA